MSSRDCKVVLLGQENVGKSCLVDRFVHGTFDSTSTVATVGASYAAKKLRTSSGEFVFQLWDTAGAERFDSLSRLYYSGAQAALVCVDPTDSSSFSKTLFWVKELKEHQPNCRCYVVLCKVDLLAEQQACPTETAPAETAPTETAPTETAESNGHAEPKEAPEEQESSDSASPSSNVFDRPPNKEQDIPRLAEGGGTYPAKQAQASVSCASPGPPGKRKAVSDSQLQLVANSINGKIAATSAKTGQGIQELFDMVAADLSHSPAPPKEAEQRHAAPDRAPRVSRVQSRLREESRAVLLNRRPGLVRKAKADCCS